jgi:regulator of replication initiation timing
MQSSSSRTIFDSKQASSQPVEGITDGLSNTIISISQHERKPGDYVVTQKTKTTVSAEGINNLIKIVANNQLDLMAQQIQELRTDLSKVLERQQKLETQNVTLLQQNRSLLKRVEALQELVSPTYNQSTPPLQPEATPNYNQSPPPLQQSGQHVPEFYSDTSQHSIDTPRSILSPFSFNAGQQHTQEQQPSDLNLNFLRNQGLAYGQDPKTQHPYIHQQLQQRAPTFFTTNQRSSSYDGLSQHDKRSDGKRHRNSDAGQPQQLAPEQDMFSYNRPGSAH